MQAARFDDLYGDGMYLGQVKEWRNVCVLAFSLPGHSPMFMRLESSAKGLMNLIWLFLVAIGRFSCLPRERERERDRSLLGRN